jgi:hypothetical protein
MHTSATTSRSVIVLGFFMVISSTVLILLTLSGEGINDLDVLDVQDSVPGIAETFHVVLKALIMVLLDSF